MLNSPRFIVYDFESSKVENLSANDSAKENVKNANPMLEEKSSILEFKNYLISDSKLLPPEITFAEKIFGSIGVKDIHYLNRADETIATEMQFLHSSSSLNLTSYLEELQKIPQDSRVLILNFSDTHSTTTATISYIQSKAFVCINTYSLNSISQHQHFKAEFWNFLKNTK